MTFWYLRRKYFLSDAVCSFLTDFLKILNISGKSSVLLELYIFILILKFYSHIEVLQNEAP